MVFPLGVFFRTFPTAQPVDDIRPLVGFRIRVTGEPEADGTLPLLLWGFKFPRVDDFNLCSFHVDSPFFKVLLKEQKTTRDARSLFFLQ
jgi:hypothetical protein